MQTDAAVRYLVRGHRASMSALYRFRDKTKCFVDDLHQQIVRLAIEQELITAEEVAIDGTYCAALASRHRIINETTLDRRTEKLDAAVKQDHQETSQEQAPTQIPNWMASTSDGRQDQLNRYHQAKEVIAERLTKNNEKYKSEQTDPAKIFVSTSDPKVPIGRDKKKCFRPLWPTQYVTEIKTGFILSSNLFERVTDVGTIGSMIDLTNAITGTTIIRIYADAGYSYVQDIEACKERRVELVAPVMENSFTAANKEKKRAAQTDQIPLFSRSEFRFDCEANQCTCPSGNVAIGTKNGSRKKADGEKQEMTKFHFSVSDCQSCPLKNKCIKPDEKQRRLTQMASQAVLDEQRAKMTPELAATCRSIRAQSAEYAFANTKSRLHLERIGCRTMERARSIAVLHIVAANVFRLNGLLKARAALEKAG